MLVSIIVKAYKSAFCLFEHLHQTPFVTTPGATCMARNTLVMNILLHLPPAPEVEFCSFLVSGGFESVSTAHTFLQIPHQVDIPPYHLARFSRPFARGGHGNIPSSYTFAAFLCQVEIPPYLVHIRRISVPSGNSTVPPCTVFLLLRPRWSRKHTHCAHFHRTSLCGSAGTTLLAFHAFYH